MAALVCNLFPWLRNSSTSDEGHVPAARESSSVLFKLAHYWIVFSFVIRIEHGYARVGVVKKTLVEMLWNAIICGCAADRLLKRVSSCFRVKCCQVCADMLQGMWYSLGAHLKSAIVSPDQDDFCDSYEGLGSEENVWNGSLTTNLAANRLKHVAWARIVVEMRCP